MKKFTVAALTAVSMLGASFAITSAASAANYTYDVLYSGGGSAALAGGSDDPLSTVLTTGDTFTYRLIATGNGEWTTLATASYFPFFSLHGSFGASSLTFTLNLLNNAANVLTFGETTGNCCAHLGANSVAFPSGLVFDQFELIATINSTVNSSTSSSLLPWPGQAPEVYAPSLISYSQSAVPEASTWLMMMAGFGLMGAAMRRKAMTVRFA